MRSSKKPTSKQPSDPLTESQPPPEELLYLKWQKQRSVHAFSKLMRAFGPQMECFLTRLRSAEVPSGIAKAEVVRRFSDAIRTFEPGTTSLHAWVYWHLRKSLRWVSTKPETLSKMSDRELYEMAIGLLKKNDTAIRNIERQVAKLARSIDAHLSPVR